MLWHSIIHAAVFESVSISRIEVICFRFEYDDPRFTQMMDLMDFAFSGSGNTSLIVDYIPLLMIIPKLKVSRYIYFFFLLCAGKKLPNEINKVISQEGYGPTYGNITRSFMVILR